jgi:hypothetical protein
MSPDSARREFEKKVLAALGLADVPVKSVTVHIAAGMMPSVTVECYMVNELRVAALGRAITEMRYRPTEAITPRPGGGPSDQESATAEAERTAAQRPVESGHETPVESGKEQGK